MKTILVIGMHRSGTSVVARLLNLAGAYLGEDREIMSADQHNQKGYWEREDVVALNDKFLETLGGRHYDPPNLAADGKANHAIAAMVEEADSFVGRKFTDRPFWAIKDPRVSVLMPIWTEAVPDAKYVVCVRNPLSVVDSLVKRNGFRAGHAEALWYIHTLRALSDTKPDRRIVLHSERVIDDPASAMRTLVAHADVPGPGEDVLSGLAEGFVDKGLEHHRYKPSDAIDSEALLPYTKQLYSAVIGGDPARINEEVATGQAVLPALYEIAHAHTRAYDREVEIQRLTGELGETRAVLQHTRDILNSRTHRMASQANQWLIKMRGSR